MKKTQLILFEGMPGAGKSTLAQWLYLRLRTSIKGIRWYSEDQTPHPINDIREDIQSEELIREVMAHWKKLSEELLKTGNKVILDGAFFSSHAGTLLMKGMEKEKIIESLHTIQKEISGLNPVFIFFQADSIERAFQEILTIRGPEWESHLIREIAASEYGIHKQVKNFQGVIDYFRSLSQMSKKIISSGKFPFLQIKNSDRNWNSYRKQILQFLEFDPSLKPYPPLPELKKFTGIYRAIDSDAEIKISENGKELFIDDERGKKLIHKEGNTFCAEGLCLELTFEKESQESEWTILSHSEMKKQSFPKRWKKAA